ncbi:CYTOCHROME P450 FAMILY 76 SUBFAMILY C POLYPEPTIDE 5-RELATED [Salix viminalis]|uniref:CYTOCHROME P450 FAMILY 76 SUBFAMILY C POLYPEPTIDE 5-RELATED n=1 Tax=Salix viminalis TaxID=40686 RepID=A0A9Q0UHA2_SALVM|nr:CYTOCHROME P450 FAMILY 76 SUBFAMILY C POLYPEPTIDE 5-RELATED [Salix viminalis]
MEYRFLLLLISFTWACLHVLIASIQLRRKSGRTVLPPGPRQLPIIGNILALGDKPHRTLAHLSRTYGPLMTLKLGTITTIVVSSPDIAKEALQKHDQAFCSRTVPDALHVQHYNFHKNTMIWLPASTHWKFLRKLAATQMFTSQRLDASQALRGKKVQELLEYVHENCNSGQAVDIEFSDLVFGVMEHIGKPNIANYFPVLRLVDPQGVRRKMNNYFKRLLQIFDSIINERTRLRSSSVASKACHDVLDALLILVEEENTELSFTDIQVLLLDMFIAGTDTTSCTVEWAMTELLLNPDKLVKAKNELQEVDGPVQESDISRCPYLQAIIADGLTPEDIDMSETFGITLHKREPLRAIPMKT